MQQKNETFGYAVGVQEFDWIRERQAPYIDKTKYVWQMATTKAKYFFLSRPRRFGKSLLVDTLRCYFEGRKELFEGLYIYNKETEWKKYPVIRIDLNPFLLIFTVAVHSDNCFYQITAAVHLQALSGILSSITRKD